jgi:hypothetical protein
VKAELVEERIIDVVPEIPKPTIRERFRLKLAAILALLRKAWNATDIDDRLFFLGLALIAIGIYQIHPALAAIITGAVLILAVRPVRRWF